jgi:YhcH/YjgK/YiaL family protein
MILDVIENLPKYASLVEGFEKAAEFLRAGDLGQFAPGRYAIDDDRVYADISRQVGRPRDGARLEAHKKYVDIQAPLTGLDTIGWKPVSRCGRPDGAYVAERDVRFFLDEPEIWMPMPVGTFAIFFPQDAHMPSIAADPFDKVVMKIRLDR